MSADALPHRLAELGIDLNPDQTAQCIRFAQLLWDANSRVNLTRHTTWDLFAARDLMDSWQLARQIPDQSDILDIGSGGGVPGMLIAILRPDLTLSLSESVGKKAAFLRETADRLALPVAILHDRAERILEDLSFDACTARAAGPISKLCQWLEGRWSQARRLLAVKGPNWKNELDDARQSGLLKKVEVQMIQRYEVSLGQSTGQDKNEPVATSFILELRGR